MGPITRMMTSDVLSTEKKLGGHLFDHTPRRVDIDVEAVCRITKGGLVYQFLVIQYNR